MGFFSSIGNFISQNVQSVVQDVGHAVGQVTQVATGIVKPVLGLVQPVMSLVQPIVALAGGDVAGGLNGLANIGQGQQTTQNPLASTGNAQTDAINQLNANQQAIVAQNQALQNQILAQQNAPKENKFLTTLKDNWYWFVGGFVLVGTSLFFVFKPKKQRYAK